MKKFLAIFLLLSASIAGFAQNARTVTGRVTEPDGTPVISAMVIEKGTTNGAATDLDGNFSIRLSGDVVLEISSIGYETANVSVPSTQNVVDVILKQDAVAALSSIHEKHVDVIFMDAPYGQGQDRRVLTALKNMPYVDEDTLIIIEEDKNADFSYLDELGYSIWKQKQYKTNQHIFIYRK